MTNNMCEVDRRWNEGVAHDPRSEELAHSISKIDWENGGVLDLRFGGHAERETLLYLLDIHFTRQNPRGTIGIQ